MMALRNLLIAVTLLVSAVCHAEQSPMEKDQNAIIATLKAQFEKPGAPLTLAPISIVNNHAVVGWTQEKTGGRALLKKTNEQWQVTLCAGDGLKGERALLDAGIDKVTAHDLAKKASQGELKLSKSRLQQMSKFNGIMDMSQAAHGH